MLWVFLLTIHLIGIVGYTVFLRKSALSSIDKILLTALMQTAVFVPTIGVILFNHGIDLALAPWQWLYLVISAVFLVGIQLFSIVALQQLETSVWTIIFNLRLIFTTILGYLFLAELPTPLQLVGGLVIFGSIMALNLHRHKRYPVNQ